MGKIDDILGKLFGDDLADKFKVKDHYTLSMTQKK